MRNTLGFDIVPNIEFVISVKENPSIQRKIIFRGDSDKNGKPFASKYTFSKSLEEAMETMGDYNIKKLPSGNVDVVGTPVYRESED